jgi:peptidase, S41 family
MTKNQTRFVPLLVSVGVIVGILIGSFFASHFSGRKLSIINTSTNKINDLFHLIDDEYVDSVSIPDLVEKSMPEILKQLDPHSTYISAKDVEASMQDLKGSFSGIGVQFTVYKDTVRVIKVVKGGPSEGVGLRAGDRIVNIDGKAYVGDTITADATRNRLKGQKGSQVRLGVLRPGQKQMLSYVVTRGDVPVKSITAAYKVSESVGYIRINSFGDNTYSEFLSALAQLNTQGFRGLILDLRGNLGGYMQPAVQIANEFLPKNRLIVYTQGRKSPREDFRSDGRGSYQNLPLVVLVDETSASASEILSGALQDNDRAMIVGRRTFGKGLVQVPIEFQDGSMLRLTKARYYTPSGRCVQKPYKLGDEEDYEADLLLREKHGEYYNPDSIKTSGQKYKTVHGRFVYGGGGIIPDVFIPADTLNMTSYFREVYLNGLMYQFAYVFTDNRRKQLSSISELDDMINFLKRSSLVEDFATYAEKNGIRRRPRMLIQSRTLFERYLISNILADAIDEEAAIMYTNRSDAAVQTAVKLIHDGKAFPVPATAYVQSSMNCTFFHIRTDRNVALVSCFLRTTSFFPLAQWYEPKKMHNGILYVV